jgi:hypothetical protein
VPSSARAWGPKIFQIPSARISGGPSRDTRGAVALVTAVALRSSSPSSSSLIEQGSGPGFKHA